jgi:hypothetical protein
MALSGYSMIEPINPATVGFYKWIKLAEDAIIPVASPQTSAVQYLMTPLDWPIEPGTIRHVSFALGLSLATDFTRARYEVGPELPAGLFIEPGVFAVPVLNHITVPIRNISNRTVVCQRGKRVVTILLEQIQVQHQWTPEVYVKQIFYSIKNRFLLISFFTGEDCGRKS